MLWGNSAENVFKYIVLAVLLTGSGGGAPALAWSEKVGLNVGENVARTIIMKTLNK